MLRDISSLAVFKDVLDFGVLRVVFSPTVLGEVLGRVVL